MLGQLFHIAIPYFLHDQHMHDRLHKIIEHDLDSSSAMLSTVFVIISNHRPLFAFRCLHMEQVKLVPQNPLNYTHLQQHTLSHVTRHSGDRCEKQLLNLLAQPTATRCKRTSSRLSRAALLNASFLKLSTAFPHFSKSIAQLSTQGGSSAAYIASTDEQPNPLTPFTSLQLINAPGPEGCLSCSCILLKPQGSPSSIP